MIDLTNPQILIPGIFILAVIIGLTLFFLLRKKPSKKPEVPEISSEELIMGLGGIKNINQVAMEHQRLKLTLENMKQVDQNVLKKLNIPAFLKGRELTLLIRHHTKTIYTQIVEQKKEVH